MNVLDSCITTVPARCWWETCCGRRRWERVQRIVGCIAIKVGDMFKTSIHGPSFEGEFVC
jgi:hypothetical protein